eukprot:4327832-Pyramimonas_sp.AAC.1
MLEKARAVNGQALAGAVGSKSRTLQFALQPDQGWKADPVFAANSLPLEAWAKAVFLGLRSDGSLEKAFSVACLLYTSPSPRDRSLS